MEKGRNNLPTDTTTKDADIIAEVQNAIRREDANVKAGDVIHRGDGEVPAPMFHVRKQGPGYTDIYDTLTGEKSVTDINMLPTQLRKRRPDGSKVFTTHDPGIKVIRGTIKCLLHKDGPNRKVYNEMGLPECNAANIPSPHQLSLHMQHKHKTAWQTIEAERLAVEKAEDREMQRALLAAAQRGVTQTQVVVKQQRQRRKGVKLDVVS